MRSKGLSWSRPVKAGPMGGESCCLKHFTSNPPRRVVVVVVVFVVVVVVVSHYVTGYENSDKSAMRR